MNYSKEMKHIIRQQNFKLNYNTATLRGMYDVQACSELSVRAKYDLIKSMDSLEYGKSYKVSYRCASPVTDWEAKQHNIENAYDNPEVIAMKLINAERVKA